MDECKKSYNVDQINSMINEAEKIDLIIDNSFRTHGYHFCDPHLKLIGEEFEDDKTTRPHILNVSNCTYTLMDIIYNVLQSRFDEIVDLLPKECQPYLLANRPPEIEFNKQQIYDENYDRKEYLIGTFAIPPFEKSYSFKCKGIEGVDKLNINNIAISKITLDKSRSITFDKPISIRHSSVTKLSENLFDEVIWRIDSIGNNEYEIVCSKHSKHNQEYNFNILEFELVYTGQVIDPKSDLIIREFNELSQIKNVIRDWNHNFSELHIYVDTGIYSVQSHGLDVRLIKALRHRGNEIFSRYEHYDITT